MFQQAAQPAAERRAGHDGTAEGVFNDRIVGAADFERAFAGADVEAGEADERSVDDQLAGEADFGDLGRRAHGFPGFAVIIRCTR
jgi:hypothetical protein